MNKIFFYATLFCLTLNINAQDFTWMRGSNQSGVAGNYGVMGTSSPTLDPGGRHGSGTWRDSNGDLWLFGGEGYTTIGSTPPYPSHWLNDLWKYTVSSNEWTWVAGTTFTNPPTVYGTLGVPAPSNQPGGREFPACWTDNNGKFWMFGGQGYGSNPSQNGFERLGDLWMYDPLTNMWTWMGGFNVTMQNGIYGTMGLPSTTNTPGARHGAATWTDAAGDLWLFGGRGYPAASFEGFLNDLWRYRVATGEWTWMGGTNLAAQPGVFGTLGVPSVNNYPGGKEFPSAWQDALGRFYIFGGRGAGYFNDLWRFDLTANTWTWLKGSSTSNQVGTYGTLNTPASANVPGGRFSQAAWTDVYGQFWMFGGQGWSATTLNNLNDLWKYDPCTNNWTWIKGRDTTNRLGIYGTILVPAPTNMPGSRIYTDHWTGKDKKTLWILGGEGFDASNFAIDHMNDVWKYDVTPPADSVFSVAGANICSTNQATLNAVSGSTSTIQWYPTATSNATLFSGAPYITPPLYAIGSPTTINYFAQVACTARPRTSIQLTVIPLPQITIIGANQTCEGTVTLTASGAATYTWTNGSNNATTTLSATTPSYTAYVLGTSLLGCENSAYHTLTILPNPTLGISTSNTSNCVGAPATVTVTGASTYSWSNNSSQNTLTLTSTTSTVMTLSVNGTAANGCTATSSTQISFLKCTGLQDLAGKIQLEFYPNPNQGQFVIQLPSNVEYELEIHSLLGQLVFQQFDKKEVISLDLDLNAGVYLITVQQGGVNYSGRLVVSEK